MNCIWTSVKDIRKLIWIFAGRTCSLKLDDEANKFYDRKHDLYEAALLTRCYTQHALRPYIDSEINHIRHFIKIPFINKGIEFIDLCVSFCSCVFRSFWYCDCLAWVGGGGGGGGGGWSWCFSYVCSICACLDLSVYSSSWCLGGAAVCDCGTT